MIWRFLPHRGDTLHQPLEYRNNFIPLDTGRFVVLHRHSTYFVCHQLMTSQNVKVQKTVKLGGFTTQMQENNLTKTKFGMYTRTHFSVPNFVLIGLGDWCLQCFDTVGWWQEGHAACKKTERWDAGMVICLGWGADLHMVQQMPLPLTVSCSSKSRLVFPSWFYLCGTAHLSSPRQNPEEP